MYHDSIDEKAVNADHYALNENIELSHKAPKYKVGNRVTINEYKTIFSKGNTENCEREIFVIDIVIVISVLKTDRWT